MTFDNLRVDVVKFRETDIDLFIDKTDEEIEDLGYLNGSDLLRYRCYTIFKLNEKSDKKAALDEYVAKYEDYFKQALMYAQLSEFYRSRSGSIGELNHERAVYYKMQFERYVDVNFIYFSTSEYVSQMGTFTVG